MGPISTSEVVRSGWCSMTPWPSLPKGLLWVCSMCNVGREILKTGKRYRRKELPIEQKESLKWLNSYRAVAEVQQLCPGPCWSAWETGNRTSMSYSGSPAKSQRTAAIDPMRT